MDLAKSPLLVTTLSVGGWRPLTDAPLWEASYPDSNRRAASAQVRKCRMESKKDSSLWCQDKVSLWEDTGLSLERWRKGGLKTQ